MTLKSRIVAVTAAVLASGSAAVAQTGTALTPSTSVDFAGTANAIGGQLVEALMAWGAVIVPIAIGFALITMLRRRVRG